jgi:tetratricopeptide (TPR) repeat protein
MKKRTFLILAVAVALLTASCNMANLERRASKIAEEYQARGLEYLENGDYDSAIAQFTNAIRFNPDFAEAYWKRCNAYYSRGCAYYERYMAYSNEDDLEQYFADSNQYLADSSWSLYIWAIRRDPNDPWAYENRASAYYFMKDYDRAIADYTHAILLDPNDRYMYLYYWRGCAYYKKGNYDRAIADYTYTIRLDSNYASAYRWRGDAYYDKKDWNRAIADYETALRLEPDYFATKYLIERAKQARGW